MSYDLDRDQIKEPSLSEMTYKAIEILSQKANGFFLMVEGSKIDWAAHANDPVGMVTEILAFDKAVNVAVEFAKKDGNTLVVIVPDHGNSGISIGNYATNNNYGKIHWSTFVDPLIKARLTGEGFEALLTEKNKDKILSNNEIRSLAKEWLDIELSDENISKILSSKMGEINYIIGPIIAQKAKIGFTTNGHTGEDVVIYSYDPRGRLLGGVLDNTAVNSFIAQSIAVDLDVATQMLFQNAMLAFKNKQADVTEDLSNIENPVLIINKGDQELRIPRNKSIAWLNNAEVYSDGVTVYNGVDWFISKKLIDLIQ